MDQLILYNYFRSSTSFRVRIGLELKQLNYEYKPVHLLSHGGEQNQPEYRKLNPMGGVPTLIHNNKVISQSLVILEYLDEAFPSTIPLFPDDPFPKAKVKQFCENINADLHSFGNLKVLQYLEQKHGFTQTDKEAWVGHWFNEGLASLEKMLSTSAKDFCFGSSITAADALLIPLLLTAERFKVDLTVYPLCSQIKENCFKNEAFLKAHPFRQIDTPAELRLK